MNKLLFLSYTASAILLIAAVWSWWASRKAELHAKVEVRLQELSRLGTTIANARATAHPSFWEGLLWRAGIKSHPWHLPVGLAGLSLLTLLGWGWNGLIGMLVIPGIAVIGGYLLLVFKARRRSALMLVQLPLYLDQVLRSLGTGRSMDGAIALATTEARAPLKEVMERVQRLATLGADMGEALEAGAALYQLKELHMLALAVQINQVYGSSPRELLQSIINMVQRRQQARRELRALTGETRVSAWVLGLLPPGMALYMMAMNPGYLEGMWHDPAGRWMIMVAVVLQALGSLILWRMVRSI